MPQAAQLRDLALRTRPFRADRVFVFGNCGLWGLCGVRARFPMMRFASERGSSAMPLPQPRRPHPASDEHLRAFGHIVHIFARFELVIQVVLASIAGGNLTLMQMVTSGLGYSGKRDALLSVLQHCSYEDDRVSRLRGFLDEIHQWSPLRNAIAHHNWKAGIRPGSIKPIYIAVRGGAGKVKGVAPEEREYTAGELMDIATGLGEVYNRLTDYLDAIGFIPARIAQATATNSSSTAASVGAPPDR